VISIFCYLENVGIADRRSFATVCGGIQKRLKSIKIRMKR